MAEQLKTLTAPIVLIKIDGHVVGKMRTLRIQEQYNRTDVRGIGELLVQEKPIIGVNCTFNCNFAVVSIDRLGTIPNPFTIKGAQTPKQFADTVLLKDTGVNLHLYKKAPKVEENGIVVEVQEDLIGVIYNAFMDSQSIDFSEGNIILSDISGAYLTPVLLSQ